MRTRKLDVTFLSPFILFGSYFFLAQCFDRSTCVSFQDGVTGGDNEQLLGNADWSVPRAFYDKTQGARFAYELHSWGCYHNNRTLGWAEPDGPRTWWVEAETTYSERWDGGPMREAFERAVTEQTMQYAMMGLASADPQGEECYGHYVYGYYELRFDWDQDGAWDITYSWAGRKDFPRSILRAFTRFPMEWRAPTD